MLLWTGINGSSRTDLQLLTNSWSWTLKRDQRGIKMVEVVEVVETVEVVEVLEVVEVVEVAEGSSRRYEDSR